MSDPNHPGSWGNTNDPDIALGAGVQRKIENRLVIEVPLTPAPFDQLRISLSAVPLVPWTKEWMDQADLVALMLLGQEVEVLVIERGHGHKEDVRTYQKPCASPWKPVRPKPVTR